MLLSTKSNRYFWVIIASIYGFRIIGLAPFAIETKTSTKNFRNIFSVNFRFSKIGQAYNIVLLVSLFVINLFALPYLFQTEYPNKSSITQISDVLQATTCTTATYFVIITWIIKQKNAVRIFNKLVEIDRLLYGTENRSINERILISLLIHVMFSVSLWTILCITLRKMAYNTHPLLFWFPIMLTSFSNYWFIVQYFIIVRLLARKFKNLNENLLRLKEFPSYLSGRRSSLNNRLMVLSFSNHSRIAALRLLYTIRTMLFEVSQDIADFFSIPIRLCIGSIFFTLVYNSYYIVTPILAPNDIFSFEIVINTIAWILVSTYPLLNLCFNVTEAVREAKFTGWIVHELLTTATMQEIKSELYQFSMQLLHETLNFTAYGLFKLDSTLLLSILGATVTYLIIFIQFMPKSA